MRANHGKERAKGAEASGQEDEEDHHGGIRRRPHEAQGRRKQENSGEQARREAQRGTQSWPGSS
jgi:hypothetical protein